MNKKLNVKQYITMSIIFAAVFAIYNIIVLLLFGDKNNIFWISYGFMCAAFAVDIGVTVFSFKTLDTEAVFMGIPLLSFSIFYFFAELFASTVFMLFRNHASTKLTVSIQLIMLLIYVIFAALALLSRDAVQGIENDIKTKVAGIKNLSVDVKILEDQCMDGELKGELHKISEAIKYSDPMTTDAVGELDELIKSKVTELKFQCNSNNKAAALQICYQLNSYISERNQRLILSK
ncbi:MAG: hypothetical protein PUB66_04570 [Oscillospiraceae bacterium]|nr:hypothetical protein [Oscillospiraceae bacterium]